MREQSPPPGFVPQGFEKGVPGQLLKDFHAQNSAITGSGAPPAGGSLEDSIGIGNRIQALNGLNSSRNKWHSPELKKMKNAGIFTSGISQGSVAYTHLTLPTKA